MGKRPTLAFAFLTDRHVASMGPAKMILACRNVGKADDALEPVQGSLKEGTKIKIWELVLLSFASVLSFADLFQDRGEKLDLLVLNAWMNTETYRKTKDGFEGVTTSNHLGGAYFPSSSCLIS
ncbi:hypothetical protein M0805_002810 [Coniferiporia weirii]|nr:hypothetical protein M0805_002810 [Coniferiporia weirii]